jgi:hypothetical protein
MSDANPKITEIEKLLSSVKLQVQIELYPGIKVTNTKQFIESHLSVIKAYGIKGIWEVFYTRLLRLVELGG